VVANQTAAVEDASRICPTAAIVQDKGKWAVDDAKCIRCNACKDVAPEDIAVVDRFQNTLPLRPVSRATVAPEQLAEMPRS
jgi:Fe-S-cluster-containing hydrogenase component 2